MSALATLLVAYAAFLGLGLACAHFLGGFAPEPFRSRRCQGTAWKQSFPEAAKQDIREFLDMFAVSFSFRRSQRLQFAPDDRIMAVYGAIYPGTGWIDGLELETLAMRTERRYGVRLAELWSEGLTFGALFAACMRAQREAAKG